MPTIKKRLNKAQDENFLDKVSKTKIKDVPSKGKKLGKRVIEKGKNLASNAVNKVKNTTVGDAAKAVASKTPIGMAYGLAKKAANTEIGKKIQEDLKPENAKKAIGNIGNVVKSGLGMDRNGGKVSKKKMRNGGSLSGLKASTKRDKGTDVGGAWTKVQNKTLAGARGKAKLTKDKQLGATKMKKK